MSLNLNDLIPEEAKLELTDKPGKAYILGKFSLRQQIWLHQTFGKDAIKGIFENQKIAEMSQIAYHLLKDKTDFPTIEDFQESILTQKDRVGLILAILHTVGFSQPVIEKLSKEMDEQPKGNDPSLSQLTGAQSTTQ